MPRPRPTRALLLVALALLAAPLFSQLSGAARAAPPSAENAIALSLAGSAPTVVERQRGGQRFTSFEGRDGLSGEPGSPALPTVAQWVGLPAGVEPRLEVTLAGAEPLPPASLPLQPVPSYHLPDDASDPLAVTALEERFEPRGELLTADGWFPAAPVRLGRPVTLRGQRMARVEFTTVQVHLATGALRWFPAAQVRLSWQGAPLPEGAAQADPLFDPLFETLLANPEQAAPWRSHPAADPAALAVAAPSANPQWRVAVETQGLFRVTRAALGVASGDAGRVALFFGPPDNRQQQALLYEGDTFYFVNSREASDWSDTLVYTFELLPSGQTGLRMAELPSSGSGSVTTTVPHALRFEEEQTYFAFEVATINEHWHWKKLVVTPALRSTSFSTPFDLPARDAASGQSVTVASEILPLDNAIFRSRRVTVTVNGSSKAQEWSTNSTGFSQVVTLPNSAMQSSGNSYTARHEYLSGAVDTMLVNAFTVRYPRLLQASNNQLFFEHPNDQARRFQVSGFSSGTLRAFELSTLGQPRTIGPAINGSSLTFGRAASPERYLVANLSAAPLLTPSAYTSPGLRSQARADYLLIAASDFQSAVQPLRSYHQGQGLSVRVVTPQQIYDDFGTGVMDPNAIRAYLQFTYDNWTPRPGYVLLVGDGNYDPRNFLGNSPPTWLPPFLVAKDEFLGEVPSDNAFVADLDGGSDGLPDLHIGRLPVNSASEASAMVGKIVGYQTSAPPGPWRRHLLFAADNPDSAGDFHEYSETLVPLLAPGARALPLYYETGDSVLAVRDSIAATINAGVLVTQYIGHAGMTTWAGDGGMWTLNRNLNGQFGNDLSLLTPNTRLPVSLPWACWDGYFIEPQVSAMSESMMRLPDRGIVASFSPVGLDLAHAHDKLARGFFEGLFSNDGNAATQPITELGALTLLAKAEVVNDSYERLIWTYMTYGDPAMHLALDPCIGTGNCPPDLFLPTVGR